jgi:exodeoxyribonuclease V gamma subunit
LARHVLHLYQSNRLETLAELLAAVLGQPQADPLASETVIVQAKGLGRWLTLDLAKRFGVCANVQFPLPASFLWKLIETVLGPQQRQGGFSPDALAWRLDALLRSTPPEALVGYLADNDGRRRWRLACRLADVFDQYLVYRPDWLDRWEHGVRVGLGSDEDWQAQLWQQLASEKDSPHRADLLKGLITRLRDPAPLDLPERVTVFGVSSLPPAVVEVLAALGERIDVCLFVLNPCRESWGDLTRAAVRQAARPGVGERLLAAWGQQGRAFFDALIERLPEQHLLFDASNAPERPHLLGWLQHDILSLAPADTPRLLADDDCSVQVHACHGLSRQAEALKDALLAAFDADKTLQPSDVVALCPDIEAWAPHIDAAFTPRDGEAFVPYAIADRGALAESPLLAAFVSLLRWPEQDWGAETVAALLDVPALARRFGFAADDVPMLRDWIARAGIRRGREDDDFAWQAGLERLLMGVVMPPASTGLPLFADRVPVADLHLPFAEAVAGLRRLVRLLARLEVALGTARPLADWVTELNGWLDALFEPDADDEAALAQVRATLTSLAQLAQNARLSEPAERAAVADWIESKLSASAGAGGFLTGGVTFAQLVPMRSLPFRIVAVLGLDDGAFPRDMPPDGFDLIARYPMRGDRTRRLDDRWLFLETLLAARDAVLLFYTGADARTDEPLPPSTVIADLLDAVRAGWLRSDGKDPTTSLCVRHTLQPFSASRFADRGPTSYASRWAVLAAKVGRGRDEPPPLLSNPAQLPIADTLSLDGLLAYVRDPGGWLLRQMGLRFERADAELDQREPFALDRDASQRLLLLAQDDADRADVLAALGHGAALLPNGMLGDAWADQAASYFAPSVATWRALAPDAQGDLTFSLTVAVGDAAICQLTLQGRLHGLGPNGQCLRETRDLGDVGRMSAWLRHLCLCAVAPAGVPHQTRLIALDGECRFGPVDDPLARLTDWLQLWLAAHRQPAPFWPRTSLAWAEVMAKPAKSATQSREAELPDEQARRALRAAQQRWVGNDRQAGEGSYESNFAVWRGRLLLDETFAQWAVRLLLPMLAAEGQP